MMVSKDRESSVNVARHWEGKLKSAKYKKIPRTLPAHQVTLRRSRSTLSSHCLGLDLFGLDLLGLDILGLSGAVAGDSRRGVGD